MGLKRLDREGKQIIIHTEGEICASKRLLIHSDSMASIVALYLDHLREHRAPVLDSLGVDVEAEGGYDRLILLLRALCDNPIERVAGMFAWADGLTGGSRRNALFHFVEGLYDFWRGFDRFMVLHSEPGPNSFDQRPYRAFNATIEELTHTVRAVYRDAQENITGDHPRVYRQVAAGCDVGLIAVPKQFHLPEKYRGKLERIPFIRHVWITPPMIIDPPKNTRTGQFQRVDRNPLDAFEIERERWLCYPAQVGPLVIFVYFHQSFIDLGCSLANLFELADDAQIAKGPDAIFFYGAPPDAMAEFGELPTVFYDDEANGLLVGAVPGEDRFGYFGYLKKMTLTLHNIAMMKRGRMPYHGAMMHILLRDGREANVLLIGDTATGKSETLEAFRLFGKDFIREMRVIADDMGSLEVDGEGRVLAYGTEIGAFIRLDDLQQGYAFSQIDRAIIMSPQKVNARVVLPVTTLGEVLHGYPVDFILYANNYESVDEYHPIVERFESLESAIHVFREGAAMAKGTTSATGLVHSYFANIFGAPQYRHLHDGLAAKTFKAAFDAGVFVGQMRTRLGIPGFESKGPEEAARALVEAISPASQPEIFGVR